MKNSTIVSTNENEISVALNTINHDFIEVTSAPNIDESELPIIKIDFKGRVIYANRASFPLLKEWTQFTNDYLPEYFTSANPNVLNPDAELSLPVETKSASVLFDIIGFKESGYIGLYGIEIIDRTQVVENSTHDTLAELI